MDIFINEFYERNICVKNKTKTCLDLAVNQTDNRTLMIKDPTVIIL